MKSKKLFFLALVNLALLYQNYRIIGMLGPNTFYILLLWTVSTLPIFQLVLNWTIGNVSSEYSYKHIGLVRIKIYWLLKSIQSTSNV